jgi:5-(carboxyamino)imidazole ribonucleotide mutase
MESSARESAQVIIIAGSESDRKTIDEAGMLKILNRLGVRWELNYASAHRNDEDLTDYCQRVLIAGAKIFIGIASMAAALPGAIAAKTLSIFPVIGVPLVASDNISGGTDALMSMIRMPPGVPVMVVGMGIPGLKNAALAAAQIISLLDETGEVRKKLDNYLFETNKKPKFGACSYTDQII